MSRYQEISNAFNESVQRQAEYISDCCEFANSLFDKAAEYSEWPSDQMFFARDIPEKFLHEGLNRCDTAVARLKEDGYIHFFVIFTVKIEYLQNYSHLRNSIQFVIPTKIRKLEETFLIQIINSSKGHQSGELMLNPANTEEFETFYECIFPPMKRSFNTRFLDFTTDDFLRLSSDPEDD